MKDQIKCLREHIFLKRIQSAAYDKHKDTLTGDNCSCMSILPKAIRAINKIKSKTLISEIKASLSSPLLDAITGAMATSFSKKYCHCDGKLRLQQSNVKKKNRFSLLWDEN